MFDFIFRKMNDVNKRILQVADYYGVSKPIDFAKKTGFSHQVSSNYLKGDRMPTVEALIKIKQVFDLNSDWLLTGKGEMLKKENTAFNKEIYKDEQNHEMIALQAEQGIPLIPEYAFAGLAPGDNSQIFELGCEKYVIPHFNGADGLISVKGSSMYPKYNSGDIVAFKKLSLGTFFQWNKVYILDTEQGLLIKRVQPADDQEHILLVSDNPSYKPFPLALTNIYSIAIVIGVIRLE